MLLAFDYPLPQTTIGRRNVSNVPAQALSLLNDPLVIQEAKRWGEACAILHVSIPEKIEALYMQAFARPPSPEEVEQIRVFLESPESKSSEQDRWASVCHAIINAKEFIFVLELSLWRSRSQSNELFRLPTLPAHQARHAARGGVRFRGSRARGSLVR